MQTDVLEVAIAKAAAIEHLDLEIDAFGKAMAVPTGEIVQDALTPVIERLDKATRNAPPHTQRQKACCVPSIKRLALSFVSVAGQT